MPRRSAASLVRAVNYAVAGIVHSLRSERNMRFHAAATVLVIVVARLLAVPRVELVALVGACALVIMSELFNTAIEAAIDVSTSSFDPRAKIAKDVAAGAVLVASAAAVAIGYLVFAPRLTAPFDDVTSQLAAGPVEITGAALAATIVGAIVLKAVTDTGTPASGGMPSGHSAVGFACFTATAMLSRDQEHHLLLSAIALLVALLVAQSRVEARIHSVGEVAVGALLGVLVTLAIFQATI